MEGTMLAIALTFSVIVSIAFLLLGTVIGYMVKGYTVEQQARYIVTHPEMFDSDGQLIPDEVLAVRFENPEDFPSDEE